jgi:predicted transcriptional regulator
MTNYFKVYLKPRNKGWKKIEVKTSEEVRKILQEAQSKHYEKYMIIKRIKRQTDIPIMQGYFTKECKVIEVEKLDVDWRIIGQSVVNYGDYIKNKRLEEEREDR